MKRELAMSDLVEYRKEPKIVLYFDISSARTDSLSFYDQAQNILPAAERSHKLGEEIILTNGRKPPFPYKTTLFGYRREFHSFDINDCCAEFVQNWLKYQESLHKVFDDYYFEGDITFEITVYNGNYPVIAFKNTFLRFVADLGITFGFDFYND